MAEENLADIDGRTDRDGQDCKPNLDTRENAELAKKRNRHVAVKRKTDGYEEMKP